MFGQRLLAVAERFLTADGGCNGGDCSAALYNDCYDGSCSSNSSCRDGGCNDYNYSMNDCMDSYYGNRPMGAFGSLSRLGGFGGLGGGCGDLGGGYGAAGLGSMLGFMIGGGMRGNYGRGMLGGVFGGMIGGLIGRALRSRN